MIHDCASERRRRPYSVVKVTLSRQLLRTLRRMIADGWHIAPFKRDYRGSLPQFGRLVRDLFVRDSVVKRIFQSTGPLSSVQRMTRDGAPEEEIQLVTDARLPQVNTNRCRSSTMNGHYSNGSNGCRCIAAFPPAAAATHAQESVLLRLLAHG